MALDQHAHDRFFKEAFSRPDVVADFMQAYLPATFIAQLRFDTLTRLHESHVGENLSEHFVDMLYAAEFGNHSLTIALLLEHKSYVEPYPHFQLNQYLLNYWQSQLRQSQPLRPVVTIVIYHGAGNWKNRPMRSYFNRLPIELVNSIPDFHYYLIDLNERNVSQKMELFRSNYAKLTAGLLATIRNKLRLVAMLESLSTVLDELAGDTAGTEFIGTGLLYVSLRSGLKKSEIIAIFHKISLKNRQKVMNAYEEWVEEGVEKATFQHLRSMLRLGIDEKTIAAILELPLKKVRAYIAQIQEQSK
ncbi:Rpn family recombination-promoting nuclease/putative transposase [Fibrella sp. WM1]|uniref:Rpn family recombination-promoting nuclease/putative transposase n=1 Tax=Fibrella musci TaxID=3242485 RepID=UPI00352084BE